MLLEIGESLQQESFNDRTYRDARLVETIKVLSDYTGQIEEEDATDRFHASIAITRQASDRCGGWPRTLRGDFDQQLLARLVAIELPASIPIVAGEVQRTGRTRSG
jgi:hypothetical protein